MEITISEFRRELFSVVAKALAGEPVVFTHRGNRFKLVPETPVDRLSRLTPLNFLNPNSDESDEKRMKAEMQSSWEHDWEEL